MKKIVTHDGIFHADEVFAIALLLETRYEVPIERTRVEESLEAYKKDPDVFVLDVGNEYDVVYHNFDHHQDSQSEAANMLILAWLNANGFINEALYMRLLIPFKAISLIDINGYDGFNGYQVNSLIKSLNFIEEGWEIALKLARNVIKSHMDSAKKEAESAQIWKEATIIEGTSIRYVDKFPITWRIQEDATFLIERVKNNIHERFPFYYKLHSKDSKLFPIFPTGKELFLHNNKFLATFDCVQDAIECAKLSLESVSP